jgi:hypothetical protein
VFLADLMFLVVLTPLASGTEPLVRMDATTVWLTDAGRATLAGRRDRVASLGLDRWLGGVHLQGRRVAYRWDPRAERIVAS